MSGSEVSCNLPPFYRYKIISGSDDAARPLRFRIAEVKDDEAVSIWLRKYEESSGISWRTARTFKCSGKFNLFRKDYRCQHKTDPRRRTKGSRLTKNTDCTATMKIVIERYYEKTGMRSPDADIKEFPCSVEIFNSHNHSVDSAAALQFRKMSSETKEELRRLFNCGHTAASARRCLQMQFHLRNAENYEEMVANASVFPSLSVIQHFYNSEHYNLYGARYGKDAVKDLEVFCKEYSDSGIGKALCSSSDGHTVVAVCTPIMQRTACLLPQAKELVLVDASGHMDQLNNRVYFFVSPGVAGGAPVGCIVADVETEEVFQTGIRLLKECFLDSSMKTRGPKVFMTDGDLREKNALSSEWPNAIYLLCQFHFLKAVWSWLCNPTHEIPHSHRQELFFAVRKLVYATTTEEFENQLLHLRNLSTTYTKFQEYLSFLLKNKDAWSSCFCEGLPVRGNNTNNYVEVVFRILKDTVLNRVKAYSIIQLIDFIITGYESYLYHRYLDFSHGRYAKSLLKKFLLDSYRDLPEQNIIFDAESSTAKVEFKGTFYVDLKSAFCTCSKGAVGQLCTHIAAVAKNCDTTSPFIYGESAREIMYRIATGKELPRKNFLKPLSFNPSAHMQESDVSGALESDDPIAHTEHMHSNHEIKEKIEAESQSSESSDDDIRELEELFERIKKERYKNSKILKPAIKKMVHNAKKLACTQTALVSALYNFGKYCGPSRATTQQSRRKGVQIPVQPTAPGRRRVSLSGKRKCSAGRPPKALRPDLPQDHQYTMNVLSLKRKAVHNLTHCVYNNVSLGKNRSAK